MLSRFGKMGTFIYTYITAERYIHLGMQFISVSIKNFKCAYPGSQWFHSYISLLEKHLSHKNKEAHIMFTAALFATSKTKTISSSVTAINHITCPAQNPSVTSEGFQNNPNVFLFTPNLFLRSKRPGPGLQLQSYPIPISYLAF